uniref:Major facilitator superfamily (MFS) profile domain-containing protein n=1 Tax=Strigamia maritima TaxID=126957 RepID=T1IKR0_STRMM
MLHAMFQIILLLTLLHCCQQYSNVTNSAAMLVPESPRWLVTNGRYKEAIIILHKIAATNGNSLPSDDELQAMKDENDRNRRCENLRLVTKLCDTLALVYYGLALNSPTLGGDPYIVVFLSGILEVPAYIIGFLVANKIGRRITYSITFLIAAALCFFIVVTPSGTMNLTWLTSTLAIMGKFIISITFGIAYVYTAELFPTIIRNIAISYGSVCGRFGSISAPYVVYLL